MTKSELLVLFKALQSVGNLSGAKFSYAVAKNTNALQPEVDALNRALEPDEAFMRYDEERMELAKSHAVRDNAGNPVVIGDSFKMVNDRKFDKELNKLKSKHKVAYAAREKQVKEFNVLLKEEVDIELHKVSADEIPEGITAAQMTGIFQIIE